jgi:geranylgeranyl transferase type-1 subunit beta
VEKGEDEEETKTPAPPVLQGVYENQPSAPTPSLQDEDSVGFNGRCNKKVDTCYAYWVTASLDVSIYILYSRMIVLIQEVDPWSR